MIFRYGTYSHPANECLVTYFGGETTYNSRGEPDIVRKRMVVEGEIVALTTDIDTRMNEIINVYKVDGGNASLTRSNGAWTAYNLPAAGSITGVRVVQRPTFLQQDGKAHMVTGLPFTIVLEAEYPAENSGLVSYSETITHTGTGGPRRVTLELDSGTPIEQIVSGNTPVTVSQVGEAVGRDGYPSVNPPIFPTQVNLPDGYVIARSAPRMHGKQYIDYPVRWAYNMTLLTLPSIPNPLLR